MDGGFLPPMQSMLCGHVGETRKGHRSQDLRWHVESHLQLAKASGDTLAQLKFQFKLQPCGVMVPRTDLNTTSNVCNNMVIMLAAYVVPTPRAQQLMLTEDVFQRHSLMGRLSC